MKLRDGSNITDEGEEKKLSWKLKTLESRSLGSGGNRFQPWLANAVAAGIAKKNNPAIQSRVALAEADTVLAKLVVDGHANAILQNDGDFPILISGNDKTMTR